MCHTAAGRLYHLVRHDVNPHQEHVVNKRRVGAIVAALHNDAEKFQHEVERVGRQRGRGLGCGDDPGHKVRNVPSAQMGNDDREKVKHGERAVTGRFQCQRMPREEPGAQNGVGL